MIQISAQYGDPKSTKFIRPFHKKLNDILNPINISKYFKSILKLSIVLRVSGDIQRFNGEGPERLKLIKKDREITIDLIISEKKWKSENKIEFSKYFEDAIRQCFDLLLEQAKKENELVDESGIRLEFNKAMKEFGSNLI